MKPDLAERFLLDECNPETKRLLEIEIDEMISGRGPRFREHHFNLYDVKLDATRKKVGIFDIFDPKESGKAELEMFHFRNLLKRFNHNRQGNHISKGSAGVLKFIASSAKKLSPKKSGIAFKNKVMKKRKERYQRFETSPLLPKKICSRGLIENGKRITILVEEDLPGQEDQNDLPKQRFSISFNKTISYRRSAESYRLKLLATMDPNLVASSGYGFYIAENSKYFKWLDKESYNRFENRPPTHYVLITHHDVYDILSYQPPEVTALSMQSSGPQDSYSQGFSIWDLV